MRISPNYYSTLYNTSMIRQSQDTSAVTASESSKTNMMKSQSVLHHRKK